ncbi:MAG: DUF366 family protein [Planctomycetota bacterium]
MKWVFLDERVHYDGSQLRAHWILDRTGLVGDALVGFVGSCDVARGEIADLQDIDGPGIRSSEMLHFLLESFDESGLELAVTRQRLFAAIAGEVLRMKLPSGIRLRREGDDLYLAEGDEPEGKLSISIATRSPVSTLMHFALNIRTEDVPVRAACLADCEVDARAFADGVAERFVTELDSIRDARAQVRSKGEHDS